MIRNDRERNEIREVTIEKDYLLHPEGSVLIATGNTKVICTAMVEERVPRFLDDENQGWVTAEYSMLPGATNYRNRRERTKNQISGRTQEIQRLIGRSLRAVVDLEKLGQRTIWIDCDVIQADGGTRTASITGAFIALYSAIEKLLVDKVISENPIIQFVAATSVGVIDDAIYLDLCYEEDFAADVDMNVVMTEDGEFVEIQGTAEEQTFSKEQLDQLLAHAEKGINELIRIQKDLLSVEEE